MLGFLFVPKTRITDDVDRQGPRIRCPKCQWVPQRSDTWLCDPGCGNVWNTFETRGLCPGCAKQWTETSCLRCSEWSKHEAWYEEGDRS